MFRSRHQCLTVLAVLLLAIALCAPAHAILVIDGRDVNGNLNGSGRNLNPAPFGLGSFEGDWQGGGGTPIAPHYFVTAAHLGGGPGGVFTFNGGTYTTVAEYTQNDLAILQTSPTDPAFTLIAPLYTGTNETGNPLIAMGRGGPPGAAVTVNNSPRGWTWAPQTDQALSWCSDTAGPIYNDNSGTYLTWAMTGSNDGQGNIVNPDSGGVSPGDSGGGVFVQDPGDSVFKLAGVLYAGDGPFNTRAVSDPNYSHSDAFSASMFNAGGFYYDGTSIQLPTGPTSAYATRISAETAFIDSVTGLPEPGSAVGLLTFMGFALCRREGSRFSGRVRRRFP